MSEKTPEELQAYFKKHTGDDGKLCKGKFRRMIQAEIGDENKGEFKRLFEEIDKDGDGKLDFEQFKEFLDVIKKLKGGGRLQLDDIKPICDMTEEELEECFKQRAGEDGKLPRCVIRRIIRKRMGDDFKRTKNPGEMRRLFEEIDKDGDGKLDFEEFKELLDVIKTVKEGGSLQLDDIKSIFDMTEEELEECFKQRAGEDGKLSRCVIRRIIRKRMGDDFKRTKNPGEMKKLWMKLDKDEDGKLDLEEFKKAVKIMKQVKEGVPFDQVKCGQ